jgi:hypothetical protein
MAMQGKELLAASEALRDAFTCDEFDQLLFFYLDKPRSFTGVTSWSDGPAG